MYFIYIAVLKTWTTIHSLIQNITQLRMSHAAPCEWSLRVTRLIDPGELTKYQATTLNLKRQKQQHKHSHSRSSQVSQVKRQDVRACGPVKRIRLVSEIRLSCWVTWPTSNTFLTTCWSVDSLIIPNCAPSLWPPHAYVWERNYEHVLGFW